MLGAGGRCARGPRNARAPLAALVAVALATGCATAPGPFRRGPPPGALTEAELRQEVLGALSTFQSRVGIAAEEIEERSPDPRIDRRALLWKIRVVPAAQQAALSEDPRLAYGRLLGVAILQRLYLSEGDGASLFGEHQARAVEAARGIERELVELGRRLLGAERVAELVGHLEAEGRSRPIAGREFAMPLRHFARSERNGGLQLAERLLSVPMVPFRTLGGVSEGAAAIQDFNDTAARFASIVERLPEQVRWQSELLLFEVESRETVRESLAIARELADRTAEIAARVERVPEDARSLLERSEDTLRVASAALREARAVAVPLRDAATEAARAGESWAALAGRGEGAPSTEAGGRPFDVTEWESALREATRAASELRALAEELQALGAGEESAAAGAGVARALDRAEGGLRGVVDHAAWRLAQLALLVFVLALVYRLLASRVGR